MEKADRISGIFMLLFASFMTVLSYRLGLGTLHKPGAGFLFFWTSIVLAGLSIAVIIRAWVQKPEGEPQSIFGGFKEYRKAALVMFLSFLYAYGMEPIGFIPVTFLFFVVVLGLIEKKGWLKSISISLAVTLLAYLLFETWLQSQLPKGLLESLRF